MTPSRKVPAGSMALAFVLLAAAAALALVAVRSSSGPRSLQDRARAVAQTLKCPICQDLSVADSPSGVSRQMRGIIERDLRSGMTPDQIRQRFVAEYGERILLSPPKSGLNLVAWLGPALALLAGLAVAGSALRRWTAGNAGSSTSTVLATEPDLSAEDRALLQRALSDPAEVPDP